jgi:hypothetical protein
MTSSSSVVLRYRSKKGRNDLIEINDQERNLFIELENERYNALRNMVVSGDLEHPELKPLTKASPIFQEHVYKHKHQKVPVAPAMSDEQKALPEYQEKLALDRLKGMMTQKDAQDALSELRRLGLVNYFNEYSYIILREFLGRQQVPLTEFFTTLTRLRTPPAPPLPAPVVGGPAVAPVVVSGPAVAPAVVGGPPSRVRLTGPPFPIIDSSRMTKAQIQNIAFDYGIFTIPYSLSKADYISRLQNEFATRTIAASASVPPTPGPSSLSGPSPSGMGVLKQEQQKRRHELLKVRMAGSGLTSRRPHYLNSRAMAGQMQAGNAFIL